MSKYSNKNAMIILAGGKSSRMGTPKAKLKFGSRTLLQHLIKVSSMTCEIAVVVVQSAADISDHANGVIWAIDAVPDEGPLRGLEAGVQKLPHRTARFFLCGCDAPLLKPELVAFLLNYSKDAQAVIPMVAGYPQPLFGVYKPDILATVTKMLQQGQRSLMGFLNAIDTHFVPEDELRTVDTTLLSFENVNTPQDYQRVLKIYEGVT